jgi:hypothetical protein
MAVCGSCLTELECLAEGGEPTYILKEWGASKDRKAIHFVNNMGLQVTLRVRDPNLAGRAIRFCPHCGAKYPWALN